MISEKVQRGFLLKAQTIVQLLFSFMFNIDFVRYQTFLYLSNNFEFAFAWYGNVLNIQDSWELSSD